MKQASLGPRQAVPDPAGEDVRCQQLVDRLLEIAIRRYSFSPATICLIAPM